MAAWGSRTGSSTLTQQRVPRSPPPLGPEAATAHQTEMRAGAACREQDGKMGEMGVSLLSVYWFLHPSAGLSVQLLNVTQNGSGGQE